ncbi:hypothetical protein BDF20DRAFT_90442 [Mycotypha africana]|uniref:uncharacterized protein n=1 Tax=Mycotypha africana TaxID=64632 RepID=UPI00230160B0|nr:uncharacterized protein BDF20DRAFT_90442 [Mycotypha africana]KAI8992142.1 hypothetical protein BDF20DRAFT_90442 [Mycotypha africana]
MYKDDKEYKLLRIIDLHEIHKVVQVTTKHKYKFVFAFVTAKRLYYVQANSQIDMDDWFKQVNQAKHDLHLYETDVDPATVDRDQEFAKDVITSYKSNHILQSQRRKSSGTYDNFLSRPSGAGVTAAALASHSNTPQFFNSNEITPTMKAIDVPKNRKNSASKGLSEYAIDRNYPLSPSSDHQHQLTTIDGIASSEDDEEFSADKANIRLEEDRNRVLIEGYLLKLGRNKGWRKRWFVLRTDTLAYYEDDKEYSPHRIIPLQHIIDSLEIDPVSKHKLFCFKIIIPKRSYVLCAPAEEDMDAWLNALVVAVRRAKKECESGHIDSSYANPTAVSPTASQAQTLQQQQEQHHYPPRPLSLIPEHKPYESQQHLNSHSSADSFENMSHLSGVSGAGGVGGAGGALGGMPTSTPLTHLHSRASERLGRAN